MISRRVCAATVAPHLSGLRATGLTLLNGELNPKGTEFHFNLKFCLSGGDVHGQEQWSLRPPEMPWSEANPRFRRKPPVLKHDGLLV